MTLIYIYLLVGCGLVLYFYECEGKELEWLIALLIALSWPVVFYYALKAAKAQKEELRRQSGQAHPPASDPGQTGKGEDKGGGA